MYLNDFFRSTSTKIRDECESSGLHKPWRDRVNHKPGALLELGNTLGSCVY